MTLLSTDPRTPGLGVRDNERKFIQFKVFGRILPTQAFGRRLELRRDMEKVAQFIEESLLDAGFNLAEPVAATPQIGQAPARVTIYGFIEHLDANEPASTREVKIIHSGGAAAETTSAGPFSRTAVVTGRPNGDRVLNSPTSATITRVAELRNAIELLVGSLMSVFMIEYNGFKFGTNFAHGYENLPTL